MAKGQFEEGAMVAPLEMGYGASEQEGVYVERRSRRTALVMTTIAVMMVCCAKLTVSGALQRSGISAMGGQNKFRFVLEEDSNTTAAAEPAQGEEGADGRSGDEGGNVTPFNPASVGCDKTQWTSSDWATWIVPGPIVTMLLAGFIFYMYGPMWAAGTLVVMIGVDALAFYTNA